MNMQRPPTIKLRLLERNHRIHWHVAELLDIKVDGDYLVCLCLLEENNIASRHNVLVDPTDKEADVFFMYNDITIHFEKDKPMQEFVELVAPYLEKYNVEKAIDKLD